VTIALVKEPDGRYAYFCIVKDNGCGFSKQARIIHTKRSAVVEPETLHRVRDQTQIYSI
jgi:hypothetical protein